MYQINLLPCQEEKERRKGFAFILLFFGVLLLGVLLTFFLNTLLVYEINKLNTNQASLSKQLAFLSIAIKNLPILKEQSEQLQTASQHLHRNAQRLKKMLAILNEVDLSLSADFFVKAIEYQRNYFLLFVYARSEKLLFPLINKIEKNCNCKIKSVYEKKYNKEFNYILTIKL